MVQEVQLFTLMLHVKQGELHWSHLRVMLLGTELFTQLGKH